MKQTFIAYICLTLEYSPIVENLSFIHFIDYLKKYSEAFPYASLWYHHYHMLKF